MTCIIIYDHFLIFLKFFIIFYKFLLFFFYKFLLFLTNVYYIWQILIIFYISYYLWPIRIIFNISYCYWQIRQMILKLHWNIHTSPHTLHYNILQLSEILEIFYKINNPGYYFRYCIVAIMKGSQCAEYRYERDIACKEWW